MSYLAFSVLVVVVLCVPVFALSTFIDWLLSRADAAEWKARISELDNEIAELEDANERLEFEFCEAKQLWEHAERELSRYREAEARYPAVFEMMISKDAEG